jgi:TetR/AcrR family transcriptional regulator, regulator of autoinduction and epiphytic fitness
MPSISERSSGKVRRPADVISRTIVETALRLFTDQGYAATSIEQVAAAARCGKHTVYRRYPSKAALFAAVVDLQSLKMAERIAAAGADRPDPLSALKELCLGVLEVFTTDEFVAFHRMCIAEAQLQPEIAAILGRNNLALVDAGERLLRSCQAKGEIIAGDPSFLIRQLAQATLHYPLDELLLAQPEFATLPARIAYFEQAWSMFFEGARPRIAG